MTRIAVTGHRGLPDEVAVLVEEAIRAELSRYEPDTLVGISCLADGADQIFARAVLEHGGSLEVVVPAAAYRDGLPDEAKSTYDDLLDRASGIKHLAHRESTSEAHMDASGEMIQDADVVFAVWDGKPARGYGGTADVVTHARSLGLPVIVVWPAGAIRD